MKTFECYRTKGKDIFPFAVESLDLVCPCSLGAQTGIRADQQLIEFVLRGRLVAEQCSEDRTQEAQRDAQNSGVLQREDRLGLDQVPSRASHCGRINCHKTWADQNQANRG